MFKFFKRKSQKEKLEKQYEVCMKAVHKLSKVNRSASDAKMAEANLILEKIKQLN